MIKTRKILVVENRPVPKNPIKPWYLPDEVEVALAFNAIHASQILEEEKDFDLIIWDTNELENFRKIIKEKDTCIPVVCLSLYEDQLLRFEEENLPGYVGGFKKPLDRALLIEAIEDVFGR